jgi:rhamnosyltransferase
MNQNVSYIVVLYEPDADFARRSIKSVSDQVLRSFAIDNSTRSRFECLEGVNCEIFRLGNNHGIGHAQNIGIKQAITEGAEYILLSDQDTIYPPKFVTEMVACIDKLKATGKVAAICPNFYDVNRSELCPMIVDAGPLGFKLKTATSGVHKVCFANASGMLIPAKVFAEVGLMREDLFIDCVDTEWCTRAEDLGYSIYCNADMVITHSLGDRSINVLGRVITQHSPLRHYYLARNSMYLALYSRHLTLNKRLFFLLRALKRVAGHAVLSAPRLENLFKGLLGLWHGVIGRLGKHE